MTRYFVTYCSRPGAELKQAVFFSETEREIFIAQLSYDRRVQIVERWER